MLPGVRAITSDGSILISGTPEVPQLSVNANADLFGIDAIFDDPIVLFDDLVVLFDGAGGVGWTQVYLNGIAVGARPILNFVDTGTVTWTVTDDPANNRINISADV